MKSPARLRGRWVQGQKPRFETAPCAGASRDYLTARPVGGDGGVVSAVPPLVVPR